MKCEIRVGDTTTAIRGFKGIKMYPPPFESRRQVVNDHYSFPKKEIIVVDQNPWLRAVVSLLNIPSDAAVYESAGFAFKCLPVPDGGASTLEEAHEFIAFVDRQLVEQHPVAVHCEAGLGPTGTMLATHLISKRDIAEVAIRRVRAAEISAVETPRQIRFLEDFAAGPDPAFRLAGPDACSHRFFADSP